MLPPEKSVKERTGLNYDYCDWRKSQRSKYATKNPLKKRAITNFLKAIIRNVEKSQNRVLEVGCGEGVATNYINKNIDIDHFIAIDIDLSSLKVAKKWNEDVDLINASIFNLPLKSGSINLVYCLEVLEHLENTTEAINELDRVVNDSIVISVPNTLLFRLANIFSLKNLRRGGEDADHRQSFSYRSLFTLLRKLMPKSKISIRKVFPWLIANITKIKKTKMLHSN